VRWWASPAAFCVLPRRVAPRQFFSFSNFEATAGLPDGLFSNQKYQFGKILEGLAMENVGIFYVHLVHFTAIWYMYFVAIWYILKLFWYIFPRFGMLHQEKSGNPELRSLHFKQMPLDGSTSTRTYVQSEPSIKCGEKCRSIFVFHCFRVRTNSLLKHLIHICTMIECCYQQL
jgi:hypothetical protein